MKKEIPSIKAELDFLDKNSQRSQEAYTYVLRKLKKKRTLNEMRVHTEGLDEFLTQLDGVVIDNDD